MKISNLNPPTSPSAISGQSGPASAARPAPAGSAPAPSSSTVEHLNSKLSDPTHDIDSLRVEEVRQAIINGELKIDANKIADGLLENLKGR